MGQKGKNKRSQEMLGKPTSWCQPDKIMHKHELSVTNDSRDAMLTLIQILHQENKDLRWQLQQSRQDHHKHLAFKKKEASPQIYRSSAEDLRKVNDKLLHQEKKDLRWQHQQCSQDHHKQIAFKKKKAYSHIRGSFSEDLGINFKKAKSKQLKKINNFKCCQFCGTEHRWGAEFCPAYGSNCNNCQMKNHFTNVCKKQAKNLK